MGTTNKLLQTALRKRTNSSRQPEAAIVTYRHTVGENGLGLNQPRHYYQKRSFGVLNKFADFSASYTQVRLYGGFIDPKTRCVLYMSAAYTRVYYTVPLNIFFFKNTDYHGTPVTTVWSSFHCMEKEEIVTGE